MIPAYWWKERNNFGDAIAPLLLEHVTGLQVQWVSHRTAGKVLATGSNMSHVLAGDIVWGAGVYQAKDHFRPQPGVTWQATRGRLSANHTGFHPVTLGDPGLLLPLIHPVELAGVDIGWAPNVMGQQTPPEGTPDFGATKTIDLTQDWQKVVHEITTCETLYTSSLHALIAAEAYGVRCVYVADPMIPRFKFEDYLTGTGRAAADLQNMTAPPRIAKLPDIQQALIVTGRNIPHLLESRANPVEVVTPAERPPDQRDQPDHEPEPEPKPEPRKSAFL